RVTDEPVALTVNIAAPSAAVGVAEIVIVEVPLSDVTDAGLNEAVMPVGSAIAVKATLSPMPAVFVVMIIVVAMPPCATLTVEGWLSVKSLMIRLPPVIVTGIGDEAM